MRFFSATRSAWSISSTFSPRWPASAAQKRPAAPAPMTTASKRAAGAGSALPDKGELQLLEEAVGHVVAHHAVALGPQPRALDGGAEQVVEERVVRRVVLVDRLVVLAVVPVVEVGRDDDVAQRPQAHADVAVVEHRLEADDDDVGVDHLL